jgi:hypothetical protein
MPQIRSLLGRQEQQHGDQRQRFSSEAGDRVYQIKK